MRTLASECRQLLNESGIVTEALNQLYSAIDEYAASAVPRNVPLVISNNLNLEESVCRFRQAEVEFPDARTGHSRDGSFDAAAGVATGGVIEGTLGLLAGIGALAIPGVGPLIAADPIMATLAGVGVGGAVGGLVGALVGMGILEYEAKRYEGAVKGGGTLLSVHCDTSDQVDTAKLR
jgi:hypothetical protein